jgi:hypothetical protein
LSAGPYQLESLKIAQGEEMHLAIHGAADGAVARGRISALFSLNAGISPSYELAKAAREFNKIKLLIK